MNKALPYILLFVVIASISTTLISRSFRVTKIPNGGKFACENCHVDPGGGGTLNQFGLAVNARVTPNGNQNFWNQSLAAIDSDGDGFSNGAELQDANGSWIVGTNNPGNFNDVTNPGNPLSKPNTTSVAGGDLPLQYKLYGNFPNPFNPTTNIVFEIPQSEIVSLKIYNSNGELIKTLVNENLNAGRYEKLWNGKDNSGIASASGIYFYQLIAGGFNKSAKMILMK